MKTTVIILNWNGKEMLRRYLPVLLHCTQEAIICVADNASSDGSLEMLQAEFPQVKTIRLDRNYGFAEGYNRALQTVETKYAVLLNSDVEVEDGWLSPLEEFMDEHSQCAACQPKLRSVKSRDRFEYAGAAGGFLDRYGYPFCRGRLFERVERDEGQYDDACRVMWATGAAMMVRMDDYNAVGGLDAKFFAHNEEIDLCWRLQLIGKEIWCVPQSVVFHVGGATLSKGNPRKTYLNFRNNLLMLYKNLPQEELATVMRIRYCLDYMAAWQALILHGHWRDFKAIYKARHDFQRMKADYRTVRQQIQQNAVGTALITPVSIVSLYFLKGVRTFSAIRPSK